MRKAGLFVVFLLVFGRYGESSAGFFLENKNVLLCFRRRS